MFLRGVEDLDAESCLDLDLHNFPAGVFPLQRWQVPSEKLMSVSGTQDPDAILAPWVVAKT